MKQILIVYSIVSLAIVQVNCQRVIVQPRRPTVTTPPTEATTQPPTTTQAPTTTAAPTTVAPTTAAATEAPKTEPPTTQPPPTTAAPTTTQPAPTTARTAQIVDAKALKEDEDFLKTWDLNFIDNFRNPDTPKGRKNAACSFQATGVVVGVLLLAAYV